MQRRSRAAFLPLGAAAPALRQAAAGIVPVVRSPIAMPMTM